MTANPRSMKRDRLVHPVVLLVPLDKSREPNFDRGLRLEAEIAAGGFDIPKAFRDVAGLEWQEMVFFGGGRRLLAGSETIEGGFRGVGLPRFQTREATPPPPA